MIRAISSRPHRASGQMHLELRCWRPRMQRVTAHRSRTAQLAGSRASRRRAPGRPRLPLLAQGLPHRRHLLLGEGLVRLLRRAGRHAPPRAPSPTSPAGCAPSTAMPGATSRPPPVDCERFCRDECIAIEMISACQHNACPGHARLRVRAARLLDDRRGGAGRRELRRDHARRRPGAAAVLRARLIAAGDAARQRLEAVTGAGIAQSMIVCSCLVITDEDIEQALVEILSQPERAAADAGRRLSPPREEDGVLRLLAAGGQHHLPEDRRAGRAAASSAPTPAPARRAACSSAPATRRRSG